MNAPSQPNLHQPVPRFGTPQPDYAVTYVTNEALGDVHVFVPDGYDIDFVRDIAENFSGRVQEPVIVYHDEIRRKFRLCPAPAPHPFAHDYGIHVLSCDMTFPPRLRQALCQREPQSWVSLPGSRGSTRLVFPDLPIAGSYTARQNPGSSADHMVGTPEGQRLAFQESFLRCGMTRHLRNASIGQKEQEKWIDFTSRCIPATSIQQRSRQQRLQNSQLSRSLEATALSRATPHQPGCGIKCLYGWDF
uniref:Uncharacterized protein n=1 Tax=Bionectria ochroleuca TaxID=29856 RepID=A0A8H7N1H2_BIOOC